LGGHFICLWQNFTNTNGDVFFKIKGIRFQSSERVMSRELRSIVGNAGFVGWQKEDNYYKRFEI
jgi:hypothetical protein